MPIIRMDGEAGHHEFMKAVKINRHLARAIVRAISGQNHHIPRPEGWFMGKGGGPDLAAGNIEQNRQAGKSFLYQADCLAMPCARVMRSVQPGHCRAGARQGAQHVCAGGNRANCRDNSRR